ncbi:C40 family peptidase [Corynebacterium urinipleomorphum]|uniref:C40 family peptidase n=1 Tax=Corynebacterium urinipleomorphum TaxID=1852380 RepID=UPI001F2497FF|nr:C40 family peptidase [Corynebacterium urinipleomorphum]
MTAALNSTGLMPVLASAGSTLIEPALSAILGSAPAPLPDISVGATPAFGAAAPLAAIVGADPGRLLSAAKNLAADRGEIEAVIGEAIPLIAHAAAGIIATGQQFLASAVSLLPGLLAGPAGFSAALSIAALAEGALGDVDKQLGELRSALEPLVARLHALVAAATERDPLVPSASAQAAGEELRATTHPAAVETADAPEAPDAVPDAPAPVPAPSTGGSEAGHAAVEAAKSMVGTPYVWGGNAPGGFDCSGLTSWAYSQAGVDIPRTAENQATGRQVSYEELQTGDLVVWSGHVAMYAGDGMMVEAGDPVQMNPVRTSNIGMPFKGFWRPTA